ncbi:hypothetical protein [Listeria sp. PSOL-1]|uniref:hypothetical protein n=1 Tax=Listeria sp. PSOL-1 TaxID=1844999 RepID=UPI0013D1D394|nr:hypothetical protein [Listeria sp. PSOL-1]
MKIEGVCKVFSQLGMEYRFGVFYIERDYLVFKQDYSFGMSKKHTYPLKTLRNIALLPENRKVCLMFECHPIQFEIDGQIEHLQPFYDELRGRSANYAPLAKKEC